MSLAEGAQIVLQVASTNEKALRLYEKMGFIRTKEISRWYRIETELQYA
jgi:ribosomal protein S18 acetylase RimI-like enzyme